MTHFTGPWKCEGEFDAEISATISAADGRSVCEIEPFCEDWTEGEIANARLIASAPELLGALKEALATMEPPHPLDDPDIEAARERARAAIDKAEGRSKSQRAETTVRRETE